MRKNHHGKKDRLVKRVFALCLALAVICTCLVPVFATEGLIDPQVHQEASRPVDDGEASYPDDEFGGFGEEEATRPVDGGEAAGFGGDEVATRPVEGGEDNLEGGPNVKETEWGTVIEYDTSTSTSTDPSSSTETQWSGEDDVVEKPDDKVVVSGDEIKKLQDMVVYRFWLKELNTLDLQDITAQAQINNMTESEYLARNGEVLWNLYFIQAVPRAETIADYSSYIENPSSNRDPKGELRQFDYWYTLDEFGNRVRLNLTDPTSNILDSKTTTVNVYAAWKDGTVGSDEEEDVDHEDLVDKNPVPVDLTAKASASYEDEKGNPKTTTLPVEVKNLPSAAHSLSVIHMGDDDMESFYKSHEDSFGEMMPILGLKISPKNAKGETVQPAKGEKATVTVSGLDKLPEIAAMEEEEALTADALKVLHQKADNTVEKLDVVSYENGTLTFETSSFSPFVIASVNGYGVETLEDRGSYTVGLQEVRTLYGYGKSNHDWSASSNDGGQVTIQKNGAKANITGVREGTVTITHTYGLWPLTHEDTYTVTVTKYAQAAIYILADPKEDADLNTESLWVPSSSELLATVDMTKLNGTWSNNKNSFDETAQGNAILSWPENAPGGTSWTIESGSTYFDQILGWIWTNKYKQDMADSLGISVDDIKKSDVKALTITVHKVSKNNGKTYPTHLDCKISVANEKSFNAIFWQYDLNTNSFKKQVDAKTYPVNSSVEKTLEDVPETIPASDGVIWEFIGWYPENTDKSVDGIYSKNEVKNWPYTPNEAELADGTVHFYAVYKPRTSNLTISKTVTGKLGDTNKAFTFQILNEEKQPVTLTSDNCQFGDGSGTLLESGTDGKFTLKHGGTVTIKNLPVGTYTVTELKTSTDELENYKTTWLLDSNPDSNNETENSTRTATVEMKGKNRVLDFTNECTLKPDTGVLLDTLPYIVILAVVAGGGILLMLRKRRKEDD